MTDYKYPEWLTAPTPPERRPFARIFGEYAPEYREVVDRLDDALLAFDAKSAECEEIVERYERRIKSDDKADAAEIAAANTRARKAEAECERLRKENEILRR